MTEHTTTAAPGPSMLGPSILGLVPQQDYADAPPSTALLNTVLEYRYTRGDHFRLTFDDDFRVTFELLNPSGGPPPTTVAYQAREIRDDDLVLVHWIDRTPGVHVSLLVDLREREIHAAAMLPPNRWELFDTAQIIDLVHHDGDLP